MDLPTAYRFPGDDETYMIGSEVGSRLDLYKGALYKRFPKLWRRVVTKEEKKVLAELGVSNRVLANWELMCIRASDGEAILKGEGLKFKGPGGFKPRVSSSPTKKLLPQKLFQSAVDSVKALRGGEAEVHMTPLMNTCTIRKEKKKDMQKRAELRRLIFPIRYGATCVTIASCFVFSSFRFLHCI